MAGKLSIKRVAALKKTRPLRRRQRPVFAGEQMEDEVVGLSLSTARQKPRDGAWPLWPLISLAEARDKLRCRKLLLEGLDPIEARRGQRTQERLEAAKAITFRQCADSYIKAHEPGWKNAKHRYQWRQTMDIACETLGDLPVAGVDTALVMKVLEPIWHDQAGNRIPAARAHRGGAGLGHRARISAPATTRPAGAATSTSCCRKPPSCACSTIRRCPMPTCRSSWLSCAPTPRSAPGHWNSRS